MTDQLKELRAMKSFRSLFEMAIREPDETLKLISKHCQAKDPYPAEHSAYFILGFLQGALFTARKGYAESIAGLAEVYKPYMDLSPGDFIGDKRRHGR